MTTAAVASDPGRIRLKLAVVSMSISSLYVLGMLFETNGHFVPQVADLYLIAQYAKGFAEGHPFQYNPGEAPTSGATSLLHTAFLGLADFVGFRGEGLIAFAILSGAVFSLLTVLQAYRAGRILSGSDRVAGLGALMVALNGPLAWSFHYGADIAMVLFLSTWLFAAWLDETEGSTRFVLPACLLALTRPEAAILVLALGVAAARDAHRVSGRWSLRPKWFLPAVAAAMVPLGMKLVTASAANTSFAQKLLPANWGAFSAAVFSVEYWSDILRGVLLGFYPSTQRLGLGDAGAPFYSPPLMLGFVFLAFLPASRALTRAGAWLFAALLTALAITPTIHLGVHFNRYLLFALPALLILFAVGLDAAAGLLGSALSIPKERAFARLAILACVFGTLSVARFALTYADFATSVYKKDEALFDFIRSRLPQDATFLSNGAAIEFRTNRRSINLSGVVTPGFAEILPVETEASAFEMLSRPEAPKLPPFFIAQESYIEASPAWGALVSGPPVFVTASLDGAELAIYPTRGDLIGRQRGLIRAEPRPEWGLVDSLNVADPIDERLHDYRFTSRVGTRSLFAALKLDTYQGSGRNAGTELADSGRVILGEEEMRLATPFAGDAWLVMRTNASPSARVRHASGERRMDLAMSESALRVQTSKGRTDWMHMALEPGWDEVAYRIPAGLLEGPVTRLRIEGRYAAYSYWVFQTRPK
ncbi:MAG: hypothetical protein ABI565_10645 [Vicinamibacteria bacterium]